MGITHEVIKDIEINNNYRRNSYRHLDYNRNRSSSLNRQSRGRRNDRSAMTEDHIMMITLMETRDGLNL